MNIKDELRDVVDLLKEVEKVNDEMQKAVEPGSQIWHQHESIDDKLNDALCKLGD